MARLEHGSAVCAVGNFPHPDRWDWHERREGDGGLAACGAQVATALRISRPNWARKVGRVHGSGLIGKEK
jgi:hypothetical protein